MFWMSSHRRGRLSEWTTDECGELFSFLKQVAAYALAWHVRVCVSALCCDLWSNSFFFFWPCGNEVWKHCIVWDVCASHKNQAQLRTNGCKYIQTHCVFAVNDKNRFTPLAVIQVLLRCPLIETHKAFWNLHWRFPHWLQKQHQHENCFRSLIKCGKNGE